MRAGQLARQRQQLGPLAQAGGLRGGFDGPVVGQLRLAGRGQVPGRLPRGYQIGQPPVQCPPLVGVEQPGGHLGGVRGHRAGLLVGHLDQAGLDEFGQAGAEDRGGGGPAEQAEGGHRGAGRPGQVGEGAGDRVGQPFGVGSHLAGRGRVPGKRFDGQRYPAGPPYHVGGCRGRQSGREAGDQCTGCGGGHGRYGEPGRGDAAQFLDVELVRGAQGDGNPTVHRDGG